MSRHHPMASMQASPYSPRKAIALLRSPTTTYLAAAALARVGAIALVPLYARRLSREEYGDYTLAQTMVTLVPAIFTLGLSAAVPRAFFGEKDAKDGLRSAGDVAVWSLVACLSFGLITLAGLAFVQIGDGHGLFEPFRLRLVIIAGMGGTLSSIPSVVLRAARRPTQAALFQLFEFFLITSLGVLFVGVFHRGFDGAIESLTGAYLVTGLVGAWFVLFRLRGRLRVTPLKRWFRFGLPFVAHFLASWLQQVSDRWTLKFVGFESALGAYAMANQITSPMLMTTYAWNDDAVAKLGEARRAGGIPALKVILRRIRLQYLLSGVVPGVLILVAMPALPWIIGNKFPDVYWMVPFLIVANLFDTQYYPAHAVLYFGDRTDFNAYVTVVSAVLNVSGNLVLVPRFGVPGAIATRIATLTLRALAVQVLAASVLRVATGKVASNP